MVTDPGGKLAKYRPAAGKLEQMAATFLEGLTALLGSIPIGLRIAEWIHDNYPFQRLSNQLAEQEALGQGIARIEDELMKAGEVGGS